MRALVTGGRGFVGRHLVDGLLEAGWDVVDYDPLVEGTGGVAPTVQELEARGRSYQWRPSDCRTLFEHWDAMPSSGVFDAAFHLAAIVGGRQVIENDPLAVAEDLAIDSAFWRWMKAGGAARAICFSSSAVYPISMQTREYYESRRLPLWENDVNFSETLGVPDMTYGWAKLTHEYLARIAWDKYDIPSTVFRPFSGYGEDQDLTYPFPSIMKRAAQFKGSQRVWGRGTQLRDFVHIDDVVRCVLQTWDAYDDATPVNISTGIGTSFIELANLAAEALGFDRSEVVIGNAPEQPEGVYYRVGDTARQNELGVCHLVHLEDGVKRGVEHFLGREGML